MFKKYKKNYKKSNNDLFLGYFKDNLNVLKI
jgi:hypothetical protein